MTCKNSLIYTSTVLNIFIRPPVIKNKEIQILYFSIKKLFKTKTYIIIYGANNKPKLHFYTQIWGGTLDFPEKFEMNQV